MQAPEEPAYDPDEILGVVPADLRTPYDIREVIARRRRRLALRRVQGALRVDAGLRLRARLRHARRHHRQQRRAVLGDAPIKGAHFVELCSQRRIPLIFLQNITGFMVGRRYEAEGIARHGAKLVTAVATTAVPKITLLVGGSFGAGNYGMAGPRLPAAVPLDLAELAASR